jgi:hemerythrin-like domain-containing protein
MASMPGAASEISPTEDLMREHVVLHRILLIYKNIISRLNGEKPYDPYLIHNAALNATNIAKSFIMDYHQVLEEQYVFPVFLQNQQDVLLIRTLLVQHNAIRCVTQKILQILTSSYLNNSEQYFGLIHLLSSFIQMYEPHSAREDTVVFPEFHYLVTPETFKALGETFEKIEEQKFGENGYESIVQQISQIEQALGIYGLGQYTPQCSQ